MFQSLFSKTALAIAGGALVLTTASGTALATQTPSHDDATVETRAASTAPADVETSRIFHGRVISKLPLNVRDRAGLKGHVIGTVQPGAKLRIICKLNSTVIDGNPRWYKIEFKDRRGWVSARYVENIGAAPHFC